MKQATLLISSDLLKKLNEDGRSLSELLHFFLKDRDLWKKIGLLKSDKYTKTYQPKGLGLVALKFYPLPEDWCELSMISNGTGFSRCYIFVYLLEYYFGMRKLSNKVTTPEEIIIKEPHTDFCKVKLYRNPYLLQRHLKSRQKEPEEPELINKVLLYK